MTAGRIRPVLRWAGGKSWLVRQIPSIFGTLEFDRFHEPFLGGGSFFFAFASGRPAVLSDKNEALIETYECIRDDVDRVIKYLEQCKNTHEDYYRIRNEIYDCPYSRAGQFIFLNQTSFNGIYRVNLKGKYNVPYGGTGKTFLDKQALTDASTALVNAELRSQDFEEGFSRISANDLVFIDPPYTVSHNNNGFIKYNQTLFSIDDQHRLSEYIGRIDRLGAKYILTNAAHAKIAEIFELGRHRIEVNRASLIGGKKAERGSVSEYVFTNIEVRPA